MLLFQQQAEKAILGFRALVMGLLDDTEALIFISKLPNNRPFYKALCQTCPPDILAELNHTSPLVYERITNGLAYYKLFDGFYDQNTTAGILRNKIKNSSRFKPVKVRMGPVIMTSTLPDSERDDIAFKLFSDPNEKNTAAHDWANIFIEKHNNSLKTIYEKMGSYGFYTLLHTFFKEASFEQIEKVFSNEKQLLAFKHIIEKDENLANLPARLLEAYITKDQLTNITVLENIDKYSQNPKDTDQPGYPIGVTPEQLIKISCWMSMASVDHVNHKKRIINCFQANLRIILDNIQKDLTSENPNKKDLIRGLKTFFDIALSLQKNLKVDSAHHDSVDIPLLCVLAGYFLKTGEAHADLLKTFIQKNIWYSHTTQFKPFNLLLYPTALDAGSRTVKHIEEIVTALQNTVKEFAEVATSHAHVGSKKKYDRDTTQILYDFIHQITGKELSLPEIKPKPLAHKNSSQKPPQLHQSNFLHALLALLYQQTIENLTKNLMQEITAKPFNKENKRYEFKTTSSQGGLCCFYAAGVDDPKVALDWMIKEIDTNDDLRREVALEIYYNYQIISQTRDAELSKKILDNKSLNDVQAKNQTVNWMPAPEQNTVEAIMQDKTLCENYLKHIQKNGYTTSVVVGAYLFHKEGVTLKTIITGISEPYVITSPESTEPITNPWGWDVNDPKIRVVGLCQHPNNSRLDHYSTCTVSVLNPEAELSDIETLSETTEFGGEESDEEIDQTDIEKAIEMSLQNNNGSEFECHEKKQSSTTGVPGTLFHKPPPPPTAYKLGTTSKQFEKK